MIRADFLSAEEQRRRAVGKNDRTEAAGHYPPIRSEGYHELLGALGRAVVDSYAFNFSISYVNKNSFQCVGVVMLFTMLTDLLPWPGKQSVPHLLVTRWARAQTLTIRQRAQALTGSAGSCASSVAACAGEGRPCLV